MIRWECWGCGGPAQPSRKCRCGWTVASTPASDRRFEASVVGGLGLGGLAAVALFLSTRGPR